MGFGAGFWFPDFGSGGWGFGVDFDRLTAGLASDLVADTTSRQGLASSVVSYRCLLWGMLSEGMPACLAIRHVFR